jgi:DNA transposition AAA+ family ATPase
MYLSSGVKTAVMVHRVRGTRQYQLARGAKIHPAVLSAMLNDMLPLKADDARVKRLALLLGLKPDQCLVPEVEIVAESVA